MGYIVAGIDIHKKVLMVVVTDASTEELHFERFRCGTTATERELLLAWLQKRAVEEVVMESTAQYWKPVWMDLEPYFGKGKLHLAQAFSNRAPQGRKHDFADAERLARRLLAGELILSLGLFLERLNLLDQQIHSLETMAAAAMKSHEDAVIRLAGVAGFGADSAQQILAEVGPEAGSFDSPGQFASWVGCCPGRSESAEHNRSSRSPKGNRFVRRILTQAAQAAVKKKGSFWQRTFRRWLVKLGYARAIWAIAHKLCRLVWKVLHEGIHYVEQGEESSPKAKQQKAQKMIRALRRMGFAVQVSNITTMPA